MKSVRKWIRDLFGFSSNEINGFLILVPLMLLLAVSEPFYRWWISGRDRHYASDSRRLDSLLAAWESARQRAAINHVPTPFDPNTASENELTALGLRPASARHIAAYRRKGGVFRIKSDLLKISGVDSTLYKQLYNYIQLPVTRLPVVSHERHGRPASGWKKRKIQDRFDINTADTLLLKTVYGIGSRLAARIVKFRDALGGFIKQEQLYEVYGLDSMVVERLTEVAFISPDFVPVKIDINHADETQLSSHPYIHGKLAQIILRYRFQHGDFIDVNDIKKLSAIEARDAERLLPYVMVKAVD